MESVDCAKSNVDARYHHTDLDRMIADMHETLGWLPKSTYASEAKPLAVANRSVCLRP